MTLQRSALRLLATLLVVGQACAALLTALHGLHVEHVRCAEHGELVHVHADEREAPAPVAESDETRRVESGSPLPSHAHDHCRGILVRQDDDPDASVLPATALQLPGAPCNAALVARSAPAGSVTTTGPPPLTRAPKTSPPLS